MSTPKSPTSPERSGRNAEGKDATAFYENNNEASKFGGSQFWGTQQAGIITDEDDDTTQKMTETDMIDQGVPVDEAFKADVIACVTFMRAKDGKAWHASNVNSAVKNEDGSSSLSLVLCSGDLCTQKKFTVAKGVVSEPTTKGGGFDWA